MEQRMIRHTGPSQDRVRSECNTSCVMEKIVSQSHVIDPGASFLASNLDDAYEFMMRVMEHPVVDCGEPLVSLERVTRESGVNVEFSSTLHVLGKSRLHLLRQGQICSFLQAAAEMNNRGWVMRVEDGYRDRIMQKFIGRQPAVFDAILRTVIRELSGEIPTPDFMLKRMLTLVAQIPKTGTHMSGSAIDISVIEQATGLELDRGAPYLDINEYTPMDSPFIGSYARKNRKEITDIMRRAGFIEYPYEFWHYSSGDAYEHVLCDKTVPARYGAVDWNSDTGCTYPILDTNCLLNDIDEIKAEINASILRVNNEKASFLSGIPRHEKIGDNVDLVVKKVESINSMWGD